MAFKTSVKPCSVSVMFSNLSLKNNSALWLKIKSANCQHSEMLRYNWAKSWSWSLTGPIMLGLVVSFREYVRDKFLLYSTVVYKVCAGSALLPSYVSQVFWLVFSKGIGGVIFVFRFFLNFFIFLFLFHIAILVRRQFIFSVSYAGCDRVWAGQSFLVDNPRSLWFHCMPWNHLDFQTQKSPT